MKKKFKIVTLGCRCNQYESEAMSAQLKNLGLLRVKKEERADICIVNTCSVTQNADKDSQKAIDELKKENPTSKLFITGCFAKDLFAGLKEDVCIIPNLQKQDLVSYIFPKRVIPKFHIKEFEDHTRAFVKIQDGCSGFCTYCIIPYTRGRSKSRKIEDILYEINTLVDNGYKEIVLTGINLGEFYSGITLSTLIQKIDEIDGLHRIRLSSIDPQHITADLVDVLINGKKTAKNLHIVLQSGSNKILKKMNRKYTKEIFVEKINVLKSKYSDFTFSTDVIVGFPSETENDFSETLKMIRKVKFSKVHVFGFSKRPNTPAYNFKEQVSQEIISKRKKILQLEAAGQAYHLRQNYIGKKLKVLFEKSKLANRRLGHTNNFLNVYVDSEKDLHNQILEVQVTSNTNKGLIGSLCE